MAAPRNAATVSSQQSLSRTVVVGGDKLIEGKDRHVNQVTPGEHRVVAIGFDAALRKALTASKRDFRRGGVRPDRRVHHLKSLLEVIALCVLSQAPNVDRIGVEGHDSPPVKSCRSRADDARGPQGQ